MCAQSSFERGKTHLNLADGLLYIGELGVVIDTFTLHISRLTLKFSLARLALLEREAQGGQPLLAGADGCHGATNLALGLGQQLLGGSTPIVVGVALLDELLFITIALVEGGALRLLLHRKVEELLFELADLAL